MVKTFAGWMAVVLIAGTAAAQSGDTSRLTISKDNRTISVSASDRAEAEAEIAEMRVGYTSYGPTLPAAYKTASESSNAIVKALLAAGAQRSQIQSESQRVSRLSDYEMKAQKGMKFSVQQSWTVSVGPKDAALVLDAAIQAGANQSGDINWKLKNSVALDGEAIMRATERARAMAESLAKSMGVVLGKPLYATNSVTGDVIRPRAMMMMAKSADTNSPAPLAIEPQRVERDATVQIIYSME